jgi:hypothetical protein
MKNMEIPAIALERFISEFLPEKKLERKYSQLELTAVAGTIISALDNINYTVSLEDIFKAFRNLSYPMSVIEPMNAAFTGQPYIDTNSHAIYIAVSRAQLKALSLAGHNNDALKIKRPETKINDLLTLFGTTI